MPMSSSSLPIQGQCSVLDRRCTLKFPFTGIEFELPAAPSEQLADFEFVIRSQKGRDMTVTIGRLPELNAFSGYGREEGDDKAILTFVFFTSNSPLARLPKI